MYYMRMCLNLCMHELSKPQFTYVIDGLLVIEKSQLFVDDMSSVMASWKFYIDFFVCTWNKQNFEFCRRMPLILFSFEYVWYAILTVYVVKIV